MSFFRERFWLVRVGGLAIVSALAASTAMTLVGTWLLDVEPAAARTPEPDEEDEEDDAPAPKVVTSPAPVKPRAMDSILARNVFCPTCTDAEEPSESPVMAEAPIVSAPMPQLRLVATMEASDPRHSLATLYDTSRRISGVFSPGDVIVPGIRLVDVRGGTVGIDHGGRTVRLRVGEDPKPEPAPAKPKPQPAKAKEPAKPKAAPKGSIPGAAEAIACTDAGVCNVERELVESLLANPALLAGQAAVRPTANGFAFGTVRAGTLPHLLGLRSGDVITEVNGESLDSLDKAIGLATKLRHATHLTVAVQRSGKLLQKEIRIS